MVISYSQFGHTFLLDLIPKEIKFLGITACQPTANYARQAENGPSNWIDYSQLRTPPTHPPALAVAGLAGVGLKWSSVES